MTNIETIYTTPDMVLAQRLLDQYRVDYVCVGPAEREFFPVPEIGKFDQFMDLVFENEVVSIYRRR